MHDFVLPGGPIAFGSEGEIEQLDRGLLAIVCDQAIRGGPGLDPACSAREAILRVLSRLLAHGEYFTTRVVGTSLWVDVPLLGAEIRSIDDISSLDRIELPLGDVRVFDTRIGDVGFGLVMISPVRRP